MRDYYQILGVSRTSSEAEIKRAYRRLVVLLHPDKNPDPNAHDQISAVNEAYDVLGDPEKRRLYDLRTMQAWAELVEPQPTPHKHRDPRYRPKRPGYTAPRKPTQRDLMIQYFPYIKWSLYASLIVTGLLFLDRALPLRTTEEKVLNVYQVHGGRRNNTYYYDVVVTDAGRKIKMYDNDGALFVDEPIIKISTTLVYAIPIRAANQAGTQHVKLGYIYSGLLFMPLLLFICSLVGVVYTKSIELQFNLAIVSGILLIITLFLIYSR